MMVKFTIASNGLALWVHIEHVVAVIPSVNEGGNLTGGTDILTSAGVVYAVSEAPESVLNLMSSRSLEFAALRAL